MTGSKQQEQKRYLPISSCEDCPHTEFVHGSIFKCDCKGIQINDDWSFPDWCPLLRSRPAPAALETEHEQYERICKEVSQEQHDAAIREQAKREERERVLKIAQHLADTIPNFNRMDYMHFLKESVRKGEP